MGENQLECENYLGYYIMTDRSVGGFNTGKQNAMQVQLAFLKLSERELKYSHLMPEKKLLASKTLTKRYYSAYFSSVIYY